MKRIRLVFSLILVLGGVSLSARGYCRSSQLCRVGLDYIEAFKVSNSGNMLAEFLKSHSDTLKIRAFLAVATTKFKTAQIIKALERNQHSSDATIKAYASLVLALVRGELTQAKLQKYLNSPILQIRVAAVRIIGRSGRKELLDWLRQVFRSERDDLVKAEIVGVWGGNRYEEAEGEIIGALSSSSWLLRNAAVMALGNMGGSHIRDILREALEREKKDIVRANIKILLSEAGIFVKADEEELNSSNPQLQGSSLVALANLDQRQVLEKTKDILLDNNAPETLRYYAAMALVIFRDKINASLGKAYINSNYLRAEFRKGGIDVEDILAKNLLSEREAVRKRVFRLLLTYSPRLIYFLMGLEDKSPLVVAQVLAVDMDGFVRRRWQEPQALREKIVATINRRCLGK